MWRMSGSARVPEPCHRHRLNRPMGWHHNRTAPENALKGSSRSMRNCCWMEYTSAKRSAPVRSVFSSSPDLHQQVSCETPSQWNGCQVMTWQDQSACKGQPIEWFFFKNLETEQVYPQVEALCAGCPVRHDCLKDAIETRSVGIWAGTTTGDRRGARRNHRELRVRMTNCGTYGGYQKHLREKTPPCTDCKVARNAYVTMQQRGGYTYGPSLKAN